MAKGAIIQARAFGSAADRDFQREKARKLGLYTMEQDFEVVVDGVEIGVYVLVVRDRIERARSVGRSVRPRTG